MLDKDLIPQAHLWSMALLIAERFIDAMFFPPVGSDDIIYRRLTLDPAAPSHLKAIEDTIYDNPLLLNPFRSISVAVDSNLFVVLPSELDADLATIAPEAIKLASGLTEIPPDEVTVTSVSAPDTAVCSMIPSTLAGFLRRTFYNVELTHPLAPIAAWLPGCDTPEGVIVASLRDDSRLDIVASRGGRLLLANSFSFDALPDAAWYIMAVRSSLPVAPSASIRLAAEPSVRQELARIISLAAPGAPAPEAVTLPASLWQAGSAVASAPLSLTLKSTL